MFSLKNPFLHGLKLTLLCLLAFSIPLSSALNNISFYALLFLYLICGDWKAKWQNFSAYRSAWFALLWWGLIFLSLSYSVAQGNAAIQVALKFNKLLLIPVLFYLVETAQERRWMFRSFSLAILITLVFGLAYPWLPESLQSHYFVPGSFFIMHIESSMMMAFFIFYCLYQSLEKDVPLKARIGFFLVTLISIYYLIGINIGRSGWITLLVLLAYLGFILLRERRLQKRSFAFFGLVILAIGLSTQTPMFQARLAEARSDLAQYQHGEESTSWGARLNFYKNTAALIEKHWLYGVGIGGFAPSYKALQQHSSNVILTVNPHDQYFDTLSELGIFGLIFLLGLYFSPFMPEKKSLLPPKNPAIPSFSLDPLESPEKWRILAQAAALSIITGSFFNSWMMDIHAGFFFCFWIVLGLRRIP